MSQHDDYVQRQNIVSILLTQKVLELHLHNALQSFSRLTVLINFECQRGRLLCHNIRQTRETQLAATSARFTSWLRLVCMIIVVSLPLLASDAHVQGHVHRHPPCSPNQDLQLVRMSQVPRLQIISCLVGGSCRYHLQVPHHCDNVTSLYCHP